MKSATRQKWEGRWEQLKGKVKSLWGDVTDDELTKTQGDYERLVGVLHDYRYRRSFRRRDAGKGSAQGRRRKILVGGRIREATCRVDPGQARRRTRQPTVILSRKHGARYRVSEHAIARRRDCSRKPVTTASQVFAGFVAQAARSSSVGGFGHPPRRRTC
jgi:uncharacterized protein YjbJ (UPF0337 family)